MLRGALSALGFSRPAAQAAPGRAHASTWPGKSCDEPIVAVRGGIQPQLVVGAGPDIAGDRDPDDEHDVVEMRRPQLNNLDSRGFPVARDRGIPSGKRCLQDQSHDGHDPQNGPDNPNHTTLLCGLANWLDHAQPFRGVMLPMGAV